jgi:hypothetical protein
VQQPHPAAVSVDARVARFGGAIGARHRFGLSVLDHATSPGALSTILLAFSAALTGPRSAASKPLSSRSVPDNEYPSKLAFQSRTAVKYLTAVSQLWIFRSGVQIESKRKRPAGQTSTRVGISVGLVVGLLRVSSNVQGSEERNGADERYR